MFFLFGVGTRRHDLGPGSTRTCSRCLHTNVWARTREETRFTLFFVPVLRWGRRELEVCPVCGTAVAL